MKQLFKGLTFRDKYLAVIIALLISATSGFGQKVVGPLIRNGASDTYPTTYDSLMRGGLQSYKRITQRDSIPVAIRKEGMQVYVADSLKYYKLANDLTTWSEFSLNVSADSVLLASRDFYKIEDTVFARRNSFADGLTKTDSTVKLGGAVSSARGLYNESPASNEFFLGADPARIEEDHKFESVIIKANNIQLNDRLSFQEDSVKINVNDQPITDTGNYYILGANKVSGALGVMQGAWPGGSGGISSVTGASVDNSDPNNPVVNAPTQAYVDSSDDSRMSKVVNDTTKATKTIIGDINLHGQINQVDKRMQVDVNAVNATNATTFLTIPTFDSSGQAVHPDIYYNPNGWNGYKYWMVFEPYPNSRARFELPSIVVSNDGVNFIVPPGLTNPIIPIPADTLNFAADGDIIEGVDGKLYVSFGKKNALGQVGQWVVESSNGITWSAPVEVITEDNMLSPSFVLKNGVYNMFYVNKATNPNTLTRRTSTSMYGPWSAAQTCTITNTTGKDLWHIEVDNVGDELHAFIITTPLNSLGTNGEMMFASSHDDTTWKMADIAFLKPSAAGWDNSAIYRSTAVLLDGGKKRYGMYYSAQSSANVWRIGYTEVNLEAVPWATTGADITRATGTVHIGSAAAASQKLAVAISDATTTIGNGNIVNIYNTNTTDNNIAGIWLGQSSSGFNLQGVGLIGIQTSHVAGSRASDLAFYTTTSNTTSEKVRISGNGSMGLGTVAAASAIFHANSTTKGFLGIPRMTAAQINAISSPANGLLAYARLQAQYRYYDSLLTKWQRVVTTDTTTLSNGNILIADGSTNKFKVGSLTSTDGTVGITTGAGTLDVSMKRLRVFTVATLPASPSIGDIAIVTDALSPVRGSTVGAGGSQKTPVFWDGTTWTVW